MLHLKIEQLRTNLSLGKTVEQWLGYEDQDNYTVLRWISIEKERDGTFSVAFIECFDEGNEGFTDVYEFSLLDPDEPEGVLRTFDTFDEAIDFSVAEYGAKSDNFVSQGMIQDEYLAYLKGIGGLES